MGDALPPVRVLHLVPHYKGNYPLFTDLVSGLDPQRFESTVCYCDRRSSADSILGEMGIAEFFLCEEGVPRRSYSSVALIRQLRRLLRERPVDIIHSQRHSATILTLLASVGMRRPPILFHVHGRIRYQRFRRKLSGFWIACNIARFVAVSESVREDLLASPWRIPPVKVVTVRNGIDPAPFIQCGLTREEARASLDLPREGFLIGTLGRLEPTKEHCHLIEAFHTFAGHYANTYLAIAGEGRLRVKLEAQIVSLGLKDRVRLMGHCPRAPVFLRSLDLFVLSSLREGLPLALLEAMAAGLLVVSTRAGGVPEVAEGVEGCVLVEPGDVEGIASGFRAMYRLSQEERARIGAANRRRVLEHFTCHRMVTDMMAVYESVLEERSSD